MKSDKYRRRFLWVTLQIENLCSNRMGVEEDVRSELSRLPEDLIAIYARIYEQMSNLGQRSRVILEKTLKWLLCAQKQLSVDEFLAAVSIDVEGTFGKVTKENVLRMCYNFVTLDPELNVFRFAHLSVKEFLETRTEYTSPAANCLVAETCLAICLNRCIGSAVGLAIKLQDYAVVYWAFHCHMAKECRSRGLLKQLFNDFTRPRNDQSSPYAKWDRKARALIHDNHHGAYKWMDPTTIEMIGSMISHHDYTPDPILAASA